MPDRIEETLSALRTDLDQVSLADSGAVRRRGQQRTRNQVLGSALATVALVAGVVGIGSGLGDGDRQSAPIATNPTVSTTPEGPPTMNPPVTEAPPGVLTKADIGMGRFPDDNVRLADDNVNAAGIETLTGGCLLGNDDLVDFGFAAFGPDPDGEPTVSQSVITQRTREDAARQLAGFESDMQACQGRSAQQPGAPAVTVVEVKGDLIPGVQDRLAALGDDAWAYEVLSPDYSSVVIGFRTANASSVLAIDTREFAPETGLKLAERAAEKMIFRYGG